MDKLRSIEGFICAVDSGNFSEAARRLDITAVMVGKHVRQLESALDTRLLQRNTRRQNLTEAGESYYRQCKQALLQLRVAEESVENMKRTPSGLLRISAPLNLGASAVAAVVARYQARYPQVKIELDLNDNFVDLIAEGFDFALRVGSLKNAEPLVAQKLGDYQMWCAPRRNIWRSTVRRKRQRRFISTAACAIWRGIRAMPGGWVRCSGRLTADLSVTMARRCARQRWPGPD